MEDNEGRALPRSLDAIPEENNSFEEGGMSDNQKVRISYSVKKIME